MAKKADAWKDYQEAAKVDMILEKLPQVSHEEKRPQVSHGEKLSQVSHEEKSPQVSHGENALR